MKRIGWKRLVAIITLGCVMNGSNCILVTKDMSFSQLVEKYDVVVMKHCYPASDVLEDIGQPDPSSDRRSIENYKAVYRLLRAKFDENPDTLFILWTLPPRHRLAGDEETRSSNAARATQFSEWLKTDFLSENGLHPNIYVFDFRSIVMDPTTNFLKYEYEKDHESGDSHPNAAANNAAGPQFAQFIVDSLLKFAVGDPKSNAAKIVFLHHSTGGAVYSYPDLGVSKWFSNYNSEHGTNLEISEKWYPADGDLRIPWPWASSRNNMPVDYYNDWLKD